MRSSLYFAAIAAFIGTGVIAGDNGDEFSNNLFTDLAPLLQLFGERFAQQFMSQSMSWIDNVIFAMAPLGIITAIVGAIRIGGPSWLKAAVGRARENRGAAEIELMSSTSDEVSELWNGQTIVRTMGKPEILQVVYTEDKEVEPHLRLHSVDELDRLDIDESQCHNLFGWFGPKYKSVDPPGQPDPEQQLKSEPQSPHSQKTLSELAKYAPNISLNNAPQRSRLEIYFWAVFGVLVQASVLVIAGLVSNWKLRKGGQPVKGYAFPITILGTLLLSLGMYCCSAIVETGSKEKKWGKLPTKGSKKENHALRILWLQRRHVVSDQSFDAYAIIARGKRDYILTSHPAHTTAQLKASSKTDNHPIVPPTTTPLFLCGIFSIFTQNSTSNAISKYILSKQFESATILGTMISLAGFTLQFIGLRASHWSVSITQLGATVIMTTIRAIIRRGLIVRPHAQLLLHDHEMDWLATRISDDPDAFWSHFSADIMHDILSEDDSNSQRHEWAIVNDADITGTGTWDSNSNNPKVVKIRQRLGQLSKWTGPASEPAISVATAVEIVMDTLFPSPSKKKIFSWSLKCLGGEVDNNAYMTVNYANGQWKADATRIDSILSLWIFHVRQAEEDRKRRRTKDNYTLLDRENEKIKQADWLREGDAALRLPCMRILCPNSESARQHLDWWGDISAAKVRAVKFINNNASEEKSTRKFDRHRVVGCITTKPPDSRSRVPQCSDNDHLTFKLDLDGSLDPSSADSSTASPPGSDLAVISDIPLPLLFAQHIFYGFMWSIAEKMEPIVGDSTLHQQDPADWKKFRLENSTLRKILAGVQQAGLGSLEEVYTYVIPPLGDKGKLPSVMAVLELARKQASHHQSLQQYQDETSVYVWLFHKCKAFDSKSPFAVKAIALLMGNLAFVTSTLELWEKQLRENRELEGLRPTLLSVLKTADPMVVSAIASVYCAELLEGWNVDISEIEYPGSSSGESPKDMLLFSDFLVARKLLAEEQKKKFQYAKDELSFSDFLVARYMAEEQINKFGHESTKGMLLFPGFLVACSWAKEQMEMSGYESTKDKLSFLDFLVARSLAKKHINKPGYESIIDELSFPDFLIARSLAEEQREKSEHENIKDMATSQAFLLTCKRLAEEQKNSGHERTKDKLSFSDFLAARSLAEQQITKSWYETTNEMLLFPDFLVAHKRLAEEQRKWPGHMSTKDELSFPDFLIDCSFAEEYNKHSVYERTRSTSCTEYNFLARLSSHSKVFWNSIIYSIDSVNAADLLERTALHYAIVLRDNSAVRRLLQLGADSKARNLINWTPLHYASWFGFDEVCWQLLRRGANIDAQGSDGRTPLHCASQRGHDKMVRLLLEAGANISIADNLRRTALHWASYCGFHGIIQRLMGAGAVINAREDQRRTPLHLSAAAGMIDTVTILLDAGADINAKDIYDDSPQHLAATLQREQVVIVLGARQNDGKYLSEDNIMTPLSLAARDGQESTVRKLLESPDVDINSKDRKLGYSALSWAAGNGHEKVVRALLERPAIDINSQSRSGLSPLSLAVTKLHCNVVQALLNRMDADINLKDRKFGNSALSWGAASGQDTVVLALLRRPDVDINCTNNNGESPLSCAAQNGHVEVVQALLQRPDVDINCRNNNGQSSLSGAASNGHVDVVLVLLERPDVDINSQSNGGRSALLWAVKNGHTNVVQAFLDRRDVQINIKNNRYGKSPLPLATENEHEIVVQALLERPDINSQSNRSRSKLSWAAETGHENIVRALLEWLAIDVNFKDNIYGQSPLSLAAEMGHENVVRELLERPDIDINSQSNNGQSPLSWAAANGHENVVRALLERPDVDINSRSNSSRSPLSWAAEEGHKNVVQALLERPNVEIDCKDGSLGQSPLSWAAKGGHENVVRELLEWPDIDINSQSNNGQSPLSWAAANGHENVVRALLERPDVDINSRSNSGRSPLSWAGRLGHAKAVEALLERSDVSIDSKDNDSHTALWLATKWNRTQVVELLQQSGARLD